MSLIKPGIFYNDPLTGGHTFFHYIKKNKRISEIQLRHLKKINNKLFVYRKNKNLFKNKPINKIMLIINKISENFKITK